MTIHHKQPWGKKIQGENHDSKILLHLFTCSPLFFSHHSRLQWCHPSPPNLPPMCLPSSQGRCYGHLYSHLPLQWEVTGQLLAAGQRVQDQGRAWRTRHHVTHSVWPEASTTVFCCFLSAPWEGRMFSNENTIINETLLWALIYLVQVQMVQSRWETARQYILKPHVCRPSDPETPLLR